MRNFNEKDKILYKTSDHVVKHITVHHEEAHFPTIKAFKSLQELTRASHTWNEKKACVVQWGANNFGQESSWCRPKSE